MAVSIHPQHGQGFFRERKCLARQIDEKTAEFMAVEEIDFALFP